MQSAYYVFTAAGHQSIYGVFLWNTVHARELDTQIFKAIFVDANINVFAG